MENIDILGLVLLSGACFGIGWFVAELRQFGKEVDAMQKKWKERAMESQIRNEVRKQMDEING